MHRRDIANGLVPVDPLAGPPMATTSVLDTAGRGDEFISASSFTTPAQPAARDDDRRGVGAQAEPEYFDAAALATQQFFARSDDGTMVPYFVVPIAITAAAGPALVYGYGGFENSRTPAIRGVAGLGWITRGGIYVMANIRGGGEYGPCWHTQATRPAGTRSTRIRLGGQRSGDARS